jgi:hypothetical protein
MERQPQNWGEVDPEERQDEKERDIDYYTNESAMQSLLQENFDKDLLDPSTIDKYDDNVSRRERNQRSQYGSYNTGPKGVLHDYKVFTENARYNAEIEKKRKQEAIQNSCITVDRNNNNDIDLLEDDEEEDEIFMAIRAEKMREMMQKGGSGEREAILVSALRQHQQKPIIAGKNFGTVTRIAQSHYVDFIDNESPEVTIILHIFQAYLPACMRMDSCLQDLARRYPKIKFGKIQALDAQSGLGMSIMDEALPMIVIYRNKENLHVATRIQDELKPSFDVDDVEEYLSSNELINISEAVDH